MTIVCDIDSLIKTLSKLREQYGETASWCLASNNFLGSDRYGIGYGLVVGKRETLENIDNMTALDFKEKVHVVGSGYEDTGILW